MKKAMFLPLILLISAIGAFAAPPANDNFANAGVLTGTGGTVNATVAEATRETGEPSHALSGTATVFRTVWYQFTSAQTKPVVLEITTAGFDPSIAVYTGAGFPLSDLVINNNTNENLPRIEFEAVAGTTYRFAIGSYNVLSVPNGAFTLQWAQNDAPTNDNFAAPMVLSGTSGLIVSTTSSAGQEAQEPTFGSGRSVWFSYANTTPNDYAVTFDTERSFNPTFDTMMAVYTGNSIGSLTTVVKNNDTPATFKSKVKFLARAGTTYRIAVDAGAGSPNGNIYLNWRISKMTYYTDFATRIGNSGEVYYDEAADISIFRPSTGTWYSIDSSNSVVSVFQFGISGDTPVPADYDGDGISDYAVTRNSGGQKVWYVRNSSDGSVSVRQWGLGTDKEVPGDFDADGRMDIAVYRASDNNWYVRRSADDSIYVKNFGLAGDIPVLGDFKNTPAGADPAVFRPSNGIWYVFDGVNTLVQQFGAAGDIPVPADYEFDGFTDRAVFRPSDGNWYLLRSNDDSVQIQHWGLAGDIPMIGDYDNNSNDKADFAVFRPSDNTWYLLRSEGTAVEYQQFGLAGDIPVSSLARLMQ